MFKTIFEVMKKSYITPRTEALQLLGESSIMIGSPAPGTNPLGDLLYGGEKSSFGGG